MTEPVNLLFRTGIFMAGLSVVIRAILSTIRTFMVPRAESDLITRIIFRTFRRIFDFFVRLAPSYHGKDRIMAFYAPVTMFLLPAVYLFLVEIGFTAMFWAVGVRSLYAAFLLSGSSLLTLGFAQVDTLPEMLLAFTDSTIGLILIATLIAYLPTMYSAFSSREKTVAMLEVRAGSPPWAVTMFERYTRLERLNELTELWKEWEHWFTELDETHTSLAMLVFFRSPRAEQSWVNAAGTVLDAAALYTSTIDVPPDAQANLTIRAGFLALRHIADFFRIPYNRDPKPDDSISVTREQFDAACIQLREAGVPLKSDLDESWKNFSGWRVNYDTVLIALADMTMAPPAPWV